jgi:hypothetical protein
VGSLSLIASCGACGRPFAANPAYVPSLRLADGGQLVFCRDCIEAANPERERRGLPRIAVHPLAYEPQEVD